MIWPLYLYVYIKYLDRWRIVSIYISLYKNDLWELITRNAHMVHIVNYIRFKMVYTS